MLHLSDEHRDFRALHCTSCDERFGDLSQLRGHDCQTEELLQRCASSTNANDVIDEIELEGWFLIIDSYELYSQYRNHDNNRLERAQSEPPNFERPWPEFRLPSEKHDIGMEAPPVLNNESMLANVLDLSSTNGLREMGLLAMRGQNPHASLSFHQPTFAPSIPNFVPPHASSGTPPRGNRQFTPTTEDDWEAMMEVSAVDETEKIRALGNKIF